MNLPPPELLVIDWPEGSLESWPRLTERLKRVAGAAGKSDLFYETSEHLRRLSRIMDGRVLADLMCKRITARAITQLWLEDAEFRRRMLSPKILDILVKQQLGQLGVVPLQNLIALYFRMFDELDQHGENLREELQDLLEQQLSKRFAHNSRSSSHQRDLLSILYSEAKWLLSINGPKHLVDYVYEEGLELDRAFLHFELRGLDDGRYASICRAHYYLNTLRELPVGQYHEVLAELLKPAVSQAPFEDGKRIGHVALEILIDRAGDAPGDEWQNFIMDLAGDPRITSTAQSYREWRQPLGEDRIEKVRRWLYKEDLRLFLSALEQFGKESGDAAMQRMFPARKRFIEGLDRLKLVRKTRLMLGAKAASAVKNILGDELRTNFVRLSNANGMSDKAVIYIDCGDFCLIEGSHNFKLWVYLRPPWERLYSYNTKQLSHSELTIRAPSGYKGLYGVDAPYEAITHSPSTWHNRFFSFLADHGVSIDIEQLMFPDDYRNYLRRFGIPYVKPLKTRLEPLSAFSPRNDHAGGGRNQG